MLNQRVGGTGFWSPLLFLLALTTEEARRRAEQLPEADHHRTPERVEQVGLIVERHAARAVAHVGLGVEQIVDLEPKRAAAQEGVLQREFGYVAQVGEEPQIERAERR